jgi:hypothetical protein
MKRYQIPRITVRGVEAAIGNAGVVGIMAFVVVAAIENARYSKPLLTKNGAAAEAVEFMARQWPGQPMDIFESRAVPLGSNSGWKVEFRNVETGSWGAFYIKVGRYGGCEYVSTYTVSPWVVSAPSPFPQGP